MGRPDRNEGVGRKKRQILSFVAAAALLLTTFAGCATMGDRAQPLVPSEHQTRTGPYVIFTNYPLPADDAVVHQLNTLKDQFEGSLGLKVDAADHPIEVYVLADRKAFEHFLTFYYPGLPLRRAFFIAQGDRRVVYTFRSDRLDEDIRHEATHALIHLAVGGIPLWLDEGLAEHFEVTDGSGVNREHLAKLPDDVRDGWKPDLARLEALQNVQQMTPRDYRESWAWVHYLLHGPSEGRGLLLGYLGEVRKGAAPRPFSARLSAGTDETASALLKHIEATRADAPAKEGAVRLQDVPLEIEPLPGPAKKRSFLSRLFGRP
jgi:hypothetical protein